MMAVRRLRDPLGLARRPRLGGGPLSPLSRSNPAGPSSRPEPTAWNGAVGGSDAYQGPDDLLPSESPVTHAKVPSGPGQDKYPCWGPATSLEEILDAPVSALAGVSDGDAEKLDAAFGIKTVRDLGSNKYFTAAAALVALSGHAG